MAVQYRVHSGGSGGMYSVVSLSQVQSTVGRRRRAVVVWPVFHQ